MIDDISWLRTFHLRGVTKSLKVPWHATLWMLLYTWRRSRNSALVQNYCTKCASRRYYESQTTASVSPTSLVLQLHHQSEVDLTAHWGERDCYPQLLTAIVPRRSPAARWRGTTASAAPSGQHPAAVVPRGGGASRRWCLGSGQRVTGNGQRAPQVVVGAPCSWCWTSSL